MMNQQMNKRPVSVDDVFSNECIVCFNNVHSCSSTSSEGDSEVFMVGFKGQSSLSETRSHCISVPAE